MKNRLFRDLRHTFENLKFYLTETAYRLADEHHHLDGQTFTVIKTDKEYTYSVTSKIIPGVQTHKELEFDPDKVYRFEGSGGRIYISGKSIMHSRIRYDDQSLKLTDGHIYSFSTSQDSGTEGKYYRRFIMPVEKDQLNFRQLESCYLDFPNKAYGEYLPVVIDKDTFYFYTSAFNNRKFVVIDSSVRTGQRPFQITCYNLLLAYGFLFGNLCHDEAFIYSYEHEEMTAFSSMEYFSMRTSILTGQATFNSNWYALNSDRLEYDEHGNHTQRIENVRKEEEINDFPLKTFSALCELFCSEENVQRAAVLFLNGHTATLELRIPAYFVAIEALASFISRSRQTKKRLNPIKDKRLAANITSRFIGDLKNVMDENNLTQEEFDLDLLTKNINKINTPPNADRLSESFTLVGYDLSKEQKKILRERNTILHGSFFSLVDEDRAFKDALSTALRVRFLIAVLILKSAGFNGKIINYNALWHYMTDIEVDEPRNEMI